MTTPGNSASRVWVFAPLLLLLVVAIAAGAVLSRGERGAKSDGLVGRPAPTLTALPRMDGEGALDPATVAGGGGYLVNLFASWCAPCRVEHPVLMDLAARGAPIIGVSYKDAPEASAAFLQELGDPYRAVGIDRDGRYGLDIGITGVPETFAIGEDGVIRAAHRGPLDEAAAARLLAAIE